MKINPMFQYICLLLFLMKIPSNKPSAGILDV